MSSPASGASDRIEIRDGGGVIGVVGIFTVAANKQGTLLELLKRYGETLKAASAPGFAGSPRIAAIRRRMWRAMSNGRAPNKDQLNE